MVLRTIFSRKGLILGLYIALSVTVLADTTFAQTNAPSQEPARPADIQSQIDSLTARVSILESAISHNLPRSWSCLARCGGFYGSRLSERPISGTGPSAYAAFNSMINQCSDLLFVDVVSDGHGNRNLVMANFQNSCIRD